MRIKSLHAKNFRLLRDALISLETLTTIIVGRNNSGKTSLTEIFRRLFEHKPLFTIYDFSITAIGEFKQALRLYIQGAELNDIRSAIPVIEFRITIDYEPEMPDLGILGNFIVDLNPECHEALIVVKFQLVDGAIEDFFSAYKDESPKTISLFMKDLKDKIEKYFACKVIAQDPNDESNSISIDYTKLKQLIGTGFINAQRGLDDITHTEKDVLGKILSKLFKTANTNSAPNEMKEMSKELHEVIGEIQTKVDSEFSKKLDALIPSLQIFGYPGLADPHLSTETTIDIADILDSQTKIRYSQGNGIYLPETYNGLGSRNLIYILFQLFEFFRSWQSNPVSNALYLIFIEEPEAHLHPQMQQVFIKQINEIANEFATSMNNGIPWPVQFIITTHSTHIANEANFESIRYFLTTRNEHKETKIKDLRKEFTDTNLKEDKEFLHKYLTLTKCDLYFADKAILIEGPTERLLMPVIIEKVDALDQSNKLTSQYISIIEVGGAYVHHFYKFLDFLELRTLVITDLDSVAKPEDSTKYTKCPPSKGTHTSNTGIKNWFDKDIKGYMLLDDCKAKTSKEKIKGLRRIAYQIPEPNRQCCGRSFEEAFMLANPAIFKTTGESDEDIEIYTFYHRPKDESKTSFAIQYGIDTTEWEAPLYITEGLLWLGINPTQIPEEAQEKISAFVEQE